MIDGSKMAQVVLKFMKVGRESLWEGKELHVCEITCTREYPS